jgi:hypothetical protein
VQGVGHASVSFGQRVMEQPPGQHRERIEGGWLDAEVRDSFPASDPLSHWAGPVRSISEADRAHHFTIPAPAEDRAEH